MTADPMRIATSLFTVAKNIAAMTPEERADVERACRVTGVSPPRLIGATEAPTVHKLRNGVAICGRMGDRVPAAWPPGNSWSAERSQITCHGCIEREFGGALGLGRHP